MNISELQFERLQELLAGSYVFEAFLGRGGSATVYKVKNLRLGRWEALKVLNEAPKNDSEFATRFANEAKVSASLDHPSIVKVYDYGEEQGTFWYSMQYVDGPSLSAELMARGRMSEVAAARVAIPLLDALDYSHKRGVVHRDIKPGNIILDRSGRPYVMDYGIAKSVDSMLETRTGLVLGTPAYVAPEQASGIVLDGRADLYAMGVTLYQAVSGTLPFVADNPLQSVVMRMTKDPRPITAECPKVAPHFAEIVMRALARDRDERYEDAAEMRRELLTFLGDRWDATGLVLAASQAEPVRLSTDEVEVDSAPTRAEPGRPRRFRASNWMMALAALLALVATVYVGLWALQRASVGRPEAGASSQGSATTVGVPADNGSAGGSSAAEMMTEAASPGVGAEQEAQDEAVVPSPTPRPARPAESTSRPAPAPRRAVHQPQLAEGVAAVVSGELAETCIGHRVMFSLTVGENGSVVRAKALSTDHPEPCSTPAAEAARTAVFSPALDAEGQPVEGRAAISVVFERGAP